MIDSISNEVRLPEHSTRKYRNRDQIGELGDYLIDAEI